MKDDILCGSACVKFILDYYGITKIELQRNMFWTAELALALKKAGLCIEVRCFNSKLYDDYIQNKKYDFDGFKYLNKMGKEKIPLIVKKFDCSQIEEEISKNDFVILCVESKIFNLDASMSGGHFIMLNWIDNKIKVINPVKNGFETLYLDSDFLVKCSENFGSWRILIKRSKL